MLSCRARYATRAILDLSLEFDRGPIPIHDIAERQNIPLKFLQQIFVALRMTGFVHSKKGPNGGYYLATAPKEITLGAVVRAMDGPIAPISCVSVTKYGECGCPHPEICSLKNSFRDARNAMAGVLDKTTFEDLAAKQRASVAVPELDEAANF
ncbi:MAG: Rrf2 family transcriptional regulator [Fimbriimonas sp.]|nr:Rrf2 family transcriptional regulator [Fimbriimonas sp.]